MQSDRSSSIILILFIAVLLVVAVTSLVVRGYLTEAPLQTPALTNSPAGEFYPISSEAPKETDTIGYTEAPEGYFSDALFIGDSRTVGLQESGGIPEAKFFATIGLGITFASYSTADVEGIGNVTLTTLLDNYTFGKIYVMLGINEIGGSLDSLSVVFKELMDKIHMYQPEAIIYILSNMHVSTEYDSLGSAVNNTNISTFNSLISQYADNEKFFYLDGNTILDDENGALSPEKSFDGIHLTAETYMEFADWLSKNAIVKQN